MLNLVRQHFCSNVGLLSTRSFQHRRLRSLHLGEHFTGGSLTEIQLARPVPLAGRKYLPSSRSPGFPKFLSGPREGYPLLVKAQNGHAASLLHWAKRSREVIEEAYRKFEKDGSAVAILFRGLPIINENDFSQWVDGLGYEPFSYVGGVSIRSEIAPNVAEGSQYPREISLESHNEMAYSTRYPKIFIMTSFKTAPYGGETAICDVREVLAKLDKNFVEKCARKQVRYWQFVRDGSKKVKGGKSWQAQFQTEEPAVVEAYLNSKGTLFLWEGKDLFFWNNMPPFITDERTGKQLWFNHISTNHCSFFLEAPYHYEKNLPNNKYPLHTTYGDGEEFEPRNIDEERRAKWESAVGFQWQDGDVLFLDNLIVQHSRMSFDGERRIGVSLLTY